MWKKKASRLKNSLSIEPHNGSNRVSLLRRVHVNGGEADIVVHIQYGECAYSEYLPLTQLIGYRIRWHYFLCGKLC